VSVVGQTTDANVLNTQPIFQYVPANFTRWTANVVPSYYQIQLSARLGF